MHAPNPNPQPRTSTPQVVKQPAFHRRLKAEMDLIEGVEVEETIAFIQARPHWRRIGVALVSHSGGCIGGRLGGCGLFEWAATG